MIENCTHFHKQSFIKTMNWLVPFLINKNTFFKMSKRSIKIALLKNMRHSQYIYSESKKGTNVFKDSHFDFKNKFQISDRNIGIRIE